MIGSQQLPRSIGTSTVHCYSSTQNIRSVFRWRQTDYDIWNAVQRTSTASRKRSGPCIQGAPVLVHPVVCCRFVWLSKHSINIILVPFFDCTFLAWQKNPAKRLFTFSFVWKRIGFKGTPRWPTVRFIPPSPTSTIPYFLFLAYHGNPTVGGG